MQPDQIGRAPPVDQVIADLRPFRAGQILERRGD
jgi:hypothetical protein